MARLMFCLRMVGRDLWMGFAQQQAQVFNSPGLSDARWAVVKRTKVDTFVLVKLFLLLPHAGAIEEKPFKTMT